MCDRSLDVVHGLPDQCRLVDVEELFGHFGKVDYVFIPPPGTLRRHEPGFVKFWDSGGAAAAFKASQNGTVYLHNSRLHCEYHRNKSAAPMGVCGGSASSTRPLDPPPAPHANRNANPAWQPMQPSAEVEDFIRIHNLASRAQAELRSLPMETQLGLVRKRYTPDVRSMDGLLIKLCRQAKGEDTRPSYRNNTRGKGGSQGARWKSGRYPKEESRKKQEQQQQGSSEDDRSRSRSWRSRSADSYSQRSQQMQDGDGDRAAPEGDIVGADPQGHERGRRARRSDSGSRSRSDSRSGEKGHDGRAHPRRVVVAQGEDKEDGNVSSLLEVSNLPDLSSKGKNATKYLCDLFNPTLKTLPDFNKEQGGDPVQKAFDVPGKAGIIFMQLQNPALAESAGRTLHGLEFGGSTMKVQGVPKAEADGLLAAQ